MFKEKNESLGLVGNRVLLSVDAHRDGRVDELGIASGEKPRGVELVGVQGIPGANEAAGPETHLQALPTLGIVLKLSQTHSQVHGSRVQTQSLSPIVRMARVSEPSHHVLMTLKAHLELRDTNDECILAPSTGAPQLSGGSEQQTTGHHRAPL